MPPKIKSQLQTGAHLRLSPMTTNRFSLSTVPSTKDNLSAALRNPQMAAPPVRESSGVSIENSVVPPKSTWMEEVGVVGNV